MTNSVSRFDDRVANYVKYRPDYPSEIVAYLSGSCGLTRESVVADIGSGTGLSTRLFLENGNRVFGVEPNAAMRQASEKYLAEFPWFIAVDGTSEATTLNDRSIDLVVAAQAFHWFDPASAREEFKRILKPNGSVVLIWNERRLDADEFHIEYEALLLKYANDYGRVRHENIAESELMGFFQRPFETKTFQNQQVFDFDGLKGRMLSSSYMPNENSPHYEQVVKDLEFIFAKHERNGRITVLYDTNVYHSTV